MLPETLSDKDRTYQKVRDQEDLGGGVSNAALYESVPMNADFQYTPSLRFIAGQTTDPEMIPLPRNEETTK